MFNNKLKSVWSFSRFPIANRSRRRYNGGMAAQSRHGRLVEHLEDRTLLAAQVVTGSINAQAVTFNDSVVLTLNYHVDDPSDSPFLFSLNVHFDSNHLEHIFTSDVFAPGLVDAPTIIQENVNDNIPETDRILAVDWLDVDGWPSGNSQPTSQNPLLLATAEFRATDLEGTTTISFTGQTDAGYDFVGEAITVTIAPPTFVVDSSDDSPTAGETTLREAVAAANAASDRAVIEFDPSISSVSLSGAPLTLANDITIAGPRADQLTIDSPGSNRVFVVDAGQNVEISGLTLDGENTGGGIENNGTLLLDGVAIRNSTATGNGGAISNAGTLNVRNSEFSANQSTGDGGAVSTTGTATIVNSTISGNSADGDGGGVSSNGTTILRNVTVTANSGSGVHQSAGTLTIRNTIVVGNAGAAQLTGAVDSDASSLTSGTAAAILAPTLSGVPTRTHAIVSGGPAENAGAEIHAIDIDGFSLLADQLGRSRVFGSSVDIGAAELVPAPGFVVRQPQNLNVAEGESISMSVVLSTPPARNVVFNVSSSDDGEANPRFSTVIFGPGNWDEAQNIPIDGVVDDVFDADQNSTISVSIDPDLSDDLFDSLLATEFTVRTNNVDVQPRLTVSIATDSVSEESGSEAASATVSRSGAVDTELIVTLNSSHTSEASVPNTVTIAAGESESPAFNINPVPDDIVDGTQTVTVTASAGGYLDGFDTIDVADSDSPSLRVHITKATIDESDGSAATTATITRNTDTTSALTVNLTSSDTSEAAVPATVTILAGQATSDPFNIDAEDDSVVDGTQTVTITASASGHADGIDTINVTDDDSVGPVGNVDGDGDFDANDSFLIHLVNLSGTNDQIGLSKGSSLLSAEEIRNAVSRFGLAADVDGDADFDANDSFLMHLVNLSGNDSQIEAAKGASPLNAGQIRTNVNNLGSSSGSTTQYTRRTVTPASSVILQSKDIDVWESQQDPEPIVDNIDDRVFDFSRNTKPGHREWIDQI